MLRKDVQRDLVPSGPGVYQFKSKGKRLLYIGKAKNLKKRLQQYFSPSSLRKQDMVAKAAYIERLPCTSEQEALLLEIQMIKHHTPPYNNLIKGTGTYVYVKISKGDYPRISIERYKKNDGGEYIGPKARRGDIRKFLHMTRYLFQWRSCSNKQLKEGIVCSDYYFGLCKGRCAYQYMSDHASSTDASTKDTLDNETNHNFGFVPAMSVEESVELSRTNKKILRALFTGRIGVFQQHIEAAIQDAIDKENFERATKLRDLHTHASDLSEKQTVVLDKNRDGIYCAIQEQGNYYLWVVIKVTDGRIIDVIGFHEHNTDTSPASLVSQVEREFLCELKSSKYEEHAYRSLSSGTLTKKELALLHDNAKRFLDGYAFSRFASQDPASRMELLENLQQEYGLSSLPERIECVDISHFGGEDTTAGLTSMHHGVLAKTMYKRYKITTAGANDDYGALREVLKRRFAPKNDTRVYPNLFVIDGGTGQLGVIRKLLAEDPALAKRTKRVQFSSLGKGQARERKGKSAGVHEILYVLGENDTVHEHPIVYTDSDKLLVLLRDEAHRFANAYRKKLAKKVFGKSGKEKS